MKTLLATVVLSTLSLTALADNNDTVKREPYTAIYQAVYKNFPLQATHRLEKAGDDWYFSSIASGFFGQIEENDTFTYDGDKIVPKHYVYRRNVLGQQRDSEITYNQKKRIASGNKDDKPIKIPLAGDELDPGTYMLALGDDLARGVKDPCYNVLDDDGVEQHCFHVMGKEVINTALGKLDTIVVERIRKPTSPRHTQFWFAPSLNYAIAKLAHQEKKGKTAYSLEITYYKTDSSK